MRFMCLKHDNYQNEAFSIDIHSIIYYHILYLSVATAVYHMIDMPFHPIILYRSVCN